MVAVRLVSPNLVHGHFKRWLAAIVGIVLHAQPDCVATTGFHNKVSTVPESPWPKVYVEQKFEIQIQIFNHFFSNHLWNDLLVKNVVRKPIQIWNLVLIFDPAQGYNFVAIQLFLFHDPIIFERATRGTNESEFNPLYPTHVWLAWIPPRKCGGSTLRNARIFLRPVLESLGWEQPIAAEFGVPKLHRKKIICVRKKVRVFRRVVITFLFYTLTPCFYALSDLLRY